MSEDNKKPRSTERLPKIEKPQLPNLGDKIGDLQNRGWDKVDGKIHEIIDKGHSGVLPPKPPVTKK